MTAPAPGDLTTLLSRAQGGDRDAAAHVYALVYAELHRIAERQPKGPHATPTLQTTALVHEAYLRLVGRDGDFADRRHFFALAATVMRGVVVDHARARTAQKRGGAAARLPLTDALAWFDAHGIDVLDLHEVLQALEAADPRKHALVQLRFFVGMSNAEAAETLGVSPATAERDWVFARAWLKTRLTGTADVP